MAKFLEVIVTSLEDAIEAEAGGADRLELVRALDLGGLTPDKDLVIEVLSRVAIPVRVMLREQASMEAGGSLEIGILQARAEAFAKLSIDGLVAGFVTGRLADARSMLEIAASAPAARITFHRAFDELADPIASIEELKQVPQIDRILTTGGEGDWAARKKRLIGWQRAAGDAVTILVGAGLCQAVLADLGGNSELREIHVGRAARVPRAVQGRVQREAVRSLKSSLQ